jgi:hypothetical protein
MLPEARSVAFASIVANQLAQTLDAGWSEGNLTRSVLGAVGGSTAVLLATLTVPPLRNFLNLVTPGPLGWTLIGAGALVSVILNRLFSSLGAVQSALPPLLASPSFKMTPA